MLWRSSVHFLSLDASELYALDVPKTEDNRCELIGCVCDVVAP